MRKNIRREDGESWGSLDGVYLGRRQQIDGKQHLCLRSKARPLVLTPGFDTVGELLDWVDANVKIVKDLALREGRNGP